MPFPIENDFINLKIENFLQKSERYRHDHARQRDVIVAWIGVLD